MGTGFQPGVTTGTRDVLEYESPAAAASIKDRGRRYFWHALVVIGVSALLIALLLPTTARKRTPAIENVNRGHAMQYKAALTQHFAEQGRYPTKLDDLVPNYLPAMRPAQPNTTWSYRTSNGSAYELTWTMSRYTWKYDSTSDTVQERAVRGQ